jgi:hypothetical protein
VRFTRPDAWLDGFERPEPSEAAAAEVVRTYLHAYGPAPREQFQRWFGMTSPAEAGRWLRALGDEVVEVDVEGDKGLMRAADAEAAAGARPSGVVRLLPAFDHYVVAAPRDAEAVLPEQHRAAVYRPQGWLSPTVVLDGRIVGTWEHEPKGAAIAVSVAPFGRRNAALREGVEAEAERLAGFLGGSLTLAWG